MKHFLINITYKVELTKIDEILPEHRKFLQEGYDKGLLLYSGPRNPRTGGIVLARAESAEQIKALFDKDPYKITNTADYEFVEFNPVKSQPFIDEWIKG
jgi:uncharacterized protein YciI